MSGSARASFKVRAEERSACTSLPLKGSSIPARCCPCETLSRHDDISLIGREHITSWNVYHTMYA